MRSRSSRAGHLHVLLTLAMAVAAAGCGAAPPTAPTLNEGGAGGGDARKTGSFPAFTGALSTNAALWDRIVEASVPKLKNDGNGFLVATIPVSERAKPSLNYLFSPANRNVADAQGMDIEFEIVTTGTPAFVHDGGPGLPPSVRAFFWSYDLKDEKSSAARWWSQVAVTLGPGGATLNLDFDPSRWSNVDGKFGSEVPADFASARAATVALGVTFGGGSSFGHGVSVTGGTADFVLKRYQVR